MITSDHPGCPSAQSSRQAEEQLTSRNVTYEECPGGVPTSGLELGPPRPDRGQLSQRPVGRRIAVM